VIPETARCKPLEIWFQDEARVGQKGTLAYVWHTSKDLNIPDNISLLKLPAYAPELNPVENVWQFLRRNKLAHRLYDTYESIMDACCDAWNFLIAEPERIKSIATRNWVNVSR